LRGEERLAVTARLCVCVCVREREREGGEGARPSLFFFSDSPPRIRPYTPRRPSPFLARAPNLAAASPNCSYPCKTAVKALSTIRLGGRGARANTRIHSAAVSDERLVPADPIPLSRPPLPPQKRRAQSKYSCQS
jgi:hypothetical protein